MHQVCLFCVGGTHNVKQYYSPEAIINMPQGILYSVILWHSCCRLNTHLIYTSREELVVISYTQALNGLSVQCGGDVLEQILSLCLQVSISIGFSRGFRKAPTHDLSNTGSNTINTAHYSTALHYGRISR